MKKNTVYYGELDRFGYDLTAVSETKEGVKNAIMEEYKRAFKDINKYDPYSEEEFEEYYQNALEDLRITELTMNHVEWL